MLAHLTCKHDQAAVAVANARDITNPARGYSGFSKVPVDLTFNIGQIGRASGRERG